MDNTHMRAFCSKGLGGMLMALVLGACTYAPEDLEVLSLQLKIQDGSPTSGAVGPGATPVISDFWRGVLVVEGPDFEPFEIQLAFDNDRLTAQTIELVIPKGPDRKISGYFFSDGSAVHTVSPFSLNNPSSNVYVYNGSVTFNLGPDQSVLLPLTLDTLTSNSNLKANLSQNEMVRVITLVDNPQTLFQDHVISSFNRARKITLPGVVTELYQTHALGFRAPQGEALDIFRTPSSTDIYQAVQRQHQIHPKVNLLNWIGKGPFRQFDNRNSISIQSGLLENLKVENPSASLTNPAQFIRSSSGQMLVLNPSATDNTWKSQDVDGDGYGWLKELLGNSDPFSSANIPLIEAGGPVPVGGTRWSTPSAFDGPQASYALVNVKFPLGQDNLATIGFIKDKDSVSNPNKDVAGFFGAVSGNLDGAITITPTEAFSDLSPTTSNGGVRDLVFCVSNLERGISIASNDASSFSHFQVVRSRTAASVSAQGISLPRFTNTLNTLIADPTASPDPFDNLVYILAQCTTEGVNFAGYTQQTKVGSTYLWFLQMHRATLAGDLGAGLGSSEDAFRIMPPVTASPRFLGSSDIFRPIAVNSINGSDFTFSWIKEVQNAVSFHELVLRTLTSAGSGGTEKTSDRNNAANLKREQMHSTPLLGGSGQVQGTLQVHVEKNTSTSKHSLFARFSKGSTFSPAAELFSVPSNTSLFIGNVHSFQNFPSNVLGDTAAVFFHTSLNDVETFYVAMVRFNTADALSGNVLQLGTVENATNNGSFHSGKVKMLSNREGLVVYPLRDTPTTYHYFAQLFRDNSQTVGSINTELVGSATRISQTATQASSSSFFSTNLLLGLDSRAGANPMVVSFVQCSTDTNCGLMVTFGRTTP
jgi:hypothetical protein